MPNVKDMKKTIKASDIPQDIIAQFDFPKPQGNQPEEVMTLIGQMDKLLTPEQCYTVMEQQGCNKAGSGADREHREFGEMHKDKSLEERLALLAESDLGHKGNYRLNDDGTLTIYFSIKADDDSCRCVCHCIRRLEKGRGRKVVVPLTFCGCCAGHLRYTHKLSLGVDLRLKEIVSSPINSGGKDHCEFVFYKEVL